MNEDPIKSYQDTLQKYNRVTRHAEELAKFMSELAMLMKDWKHVIVADGKTRFPVGVGKYSINPRNYPPIQRVAETLSIWHQVRIELRNKWNAIPVERKVGLQPPSLD